MKAIVLLSLKDIIQHIDCKRGVYYEENKIQ